MSACKNKQLAKRNIGLISKDMNVMLVEVKLKAEKVTEIIKCKLCLILKVYIYIYIYIYIYTIYDLQMNIDVTLIFPDDIVTILP